MRQIIPYLLWIGNAVEARDVRAVSSLGIRAVIDLAANEPPIHYSRDTVYCRLPLTDGMGNDAAIIRLAVSSTAEFIKARVPTLVTCSAGMSRSPAIVAAAKIRQQLFNLRMHVLGLGNDEHADSGIQLHRPQSQRHIIRFIEIINLEE